jgi:hypothetical protein
VDAAEEGGLEAWSQPWRNQRKQHQEWEEPYPLSGLQLHQLPPSFDQPAGVSSGREWDVPVFREIDFNQDTWVRVG